MRVLLLAVATLLVCCSSTPDPLAVAEEGCRVHVFGVIDAGKCDQYPNLLDCHEYVAAMAECGALLRAAAEAK